MIDAFLRNTEDQVILWAGNAEQAGVIAAEHAAAGTAVAMFVSESRLSDSSIQDALATWRSDFPTARRVVLIDRDRLLEERPQLVVDLGANHLDALLLMPAGPRDEEFHAAITELLSDWAATSQAGHNAWVQTVSTGNEPLTFDLCDFFDRLGYPHQIYAPDSSLDVQSSPAPLGPHYRW